MKQVSQNVAYRRRPHRAIEMLTFMLLPIQSNPLIIFRSIQNNSLIEHWNEVYYDEEEEWNKKALQMFGMSHPTHTRKESQPIEDVK